MENVDVSGLKKRNEGCFFMPVAGEQEKIMLADTPCPSSMADITNQSLSSSYLVTPESFSSSHCQLTGVGMHNKSHLPSMSWLKAVVIK